VKKNYKPARSNFYLGEIAYKKEQWRTAIKHYKISIDLYDKADYIPRLLYHTAISFDKIGEPSNANAFYKALKTNYPNSKEAKASPDR
jgi:TolA-binding protein